MAAIGVWVPRSLGRLPILGFLLPRGQFCVSGGSPPSARRSSSRLLARWCQASVRRPPEANLERACYSSASTLERRSSGGSCRRLLFFRLTGIFVQINCSTSALCGLLWLLRSEVTQRPPRFHGLKLLKPPNPKSIPNWTSSSQ